MQYYLAEACYNSFVLFDRLHLLKVEESMVEHVHAVLLREGRDDALILIDGGVKEGSFYARMMVLGVDKMFGEFCGNGARACAAYLYTQYPQYASFFLKTDYGVHALGKHENGDYSVMLPPTRFEINDKFMTCHAFPPFSYVEVIEPHLVLQGNLSDEELYFIGKELNRRKDLFPLGMNVNAWHFLKEGSLYVKTYERGVQRLTQSCGTGSMACVASSGIQGGVKVKTAGGTLTITLCSQGNELKGPAFFCDKDKRETRV